MVFSQYFKLLNAYIIKDWNVKLYKVYNRQFYINTILFYRDLLCLLF